MIQTIMQTTVQVGGQRQVRLIVVAGGNLYVGNLDALPLATGGEGLFAPVARPQAASSQQKIYLVDGSPIITQVDEDGSVSAPYTVTAGIAPERCRLACIYRDRLVLGGSDDDPHNLFFSRAGVHTDWDYGQTDRTAAFAANAGLAGRIGDIVTALIPFVDDALLIGGDHTIHRLNGDPMDGGSIDRVSDGVGVLGPDAWCQDPAGNIYFVGTTGLFRMQIDGSVENLSAGRTNQLFQAINRNKTWVQAQYDRDRHGVWIFFTPRSSGENGTHLWYDLRTDGFFPIRFASAAVGPTASLVFDGDDPDDRMLLLGTRGNWLRRMSDSALSDDGVGIESRCAIGPVLPAGDVDEAKMVGLDVVLGELPEGVESWSVDYAVLAGDDPERTLNAPRQEKGGTFDVPGRQKPLGHRLAGQSFFVRLGASAAPWSLERVVGRFQPAGRKR